MLELQYLVGKLSQLPCDCIKAVWECNRPVNDIFIFYVIEQDRKMRQPIPLIHLKMTLHRVFFFDPCIYLKLAIAHFLAKRICELYLGTNCISNDNSRFTIIDN